MNHFESAHVVPTDELGRPLPSSPLGDVGQGAAPVLTPQQITKLVHQQVLQQQGHGQQQQFGGVVDDAASPESSIGPTTPPSTHSFASGVVAAYEQQSQLAQPQPRSQHQHQYHDPDHASQQSSPMSPHQHFGADVLDPYQHHDGGGAAYQDAQSPSQSSQAHDSQVQAQMMQQQQQQHQMQMPMSPQGQMQYHQTAASHSQQQQQQPSFGMEDVNVTTSPLASGLSTPAANYAQRPLQVPQMHMQMHTAMQQQQQMAGAYNGFRAALPASPPQDAFGMTSVVRRRTSPVALSAHASLSSLSMYPASSSVSVGAHAHALSRANSLGSVPRGTALSSARGAIDEDDVLMDFDPLDDAPFISHASHPAHAHIASPVPAAMHARRTLSPAEQPQVCLPPALFSAPTPSPGLAASRSGGSGYFDDVVAAPGRVRSTPASRAASPGGRTSGVVRTKSSKSAAKDGASASASGSGSALATNLLITGAAAEKQRLKAKLAVLDPLAIRERVGEAKEAKEPSSSSSSSSGTGGREGKSGRRSREKGYKCPIPGCTKSYLNPNGLKYHLNKGTCTIAPGAGSGSGLTTASMPTTPAVSTPSSMVGTPMASAPASPILEEHDALVAHTQQHLVSYQSQHSELQNALMPTY